tara:strand:+ start:1997 stop:3604 length:1608 start_codon:yes stop_codon:yes gene_type:complete
MTENTISQPNVTLQITSADVPVSNAPQRILVVGQTTPAGTATNSVPGANIVIPNIGNDGNENSLFGPGSNLALMIRKIKQVAPQVQVDAIPIADNGSVKTVYTITFTTSSNQAGTVELILGGRPDFVYSASFASGASVTDIVDAIYAKASVDVNSPFTFAKTSGVITVTAKNAGTAAGHYPVGVKLYAPTGTSLGTDCAIARTTQGAGDPTVVEADFTAIADTRYQAVVGLSLWGALRTLMEARFNTSNSVLDGVFFSGQSLTSGAAITALTALNFKTSVYFVDEFTNIVDIDGMGQHAYIGPANQNADHIVASWFAAVRALRLTPNTSIGNYVTTRSSGDQLGGPSTATLPYHNTNAPQLSTTLDVPGVGFTDIEIEAIKAVGGSIIGTNRTGTNAIVGEVSTTLKTDPSGNPDPSFKYLNYVDTISASREYFFNNYKKRFAQSRLTQGAMQQGRDMINQIGFEAYTDRLYSDQTRSELLLLQDGQEAINYFKANRIVSLDMLTGTINVNMKVPIISQVRNIIGTVEISFSTEG